MTFLVGKIALGVNAGAPNNGRGVDNVAKVKQMWVSRELYPYVSAQAFRRWIRDSLPATEKRSPVKRSGKGQNQQAYSAGRPDLYLDDDLFGYMVAEKGANFQRDTVLATGTLVAVAPQRPTQDFGTMSRGFAAGDNPVIHEHEHYTADLAGDVLLDLPRVGTFELEGGGMRQALAAEAVQEAKAAGAVDAVLRDVACLRLPLVERRRRAALVLRTFAEVRGGAKQALHYGERSPALVLLAPLKGGNNPFTRVLGVDAGRTRFDTDVLTEEIAAWHDELDGPVYLGWAPGYLGVQRDKARHDLGELIAAGRLILDHPRVLLRRLADDIESGDRDGWFEDPQR
jgi:CRISPR-associated protein Cst2